MPVSVDEFINDSDPPISAERLNEPFAIKSAVYDSGNDEIQITIGQGRVLYGNNNIIETTSDTNITVSGPSTNTEYYVYLNSNGQFPTSTSLDTDKVLLGSVETGGSLNDQDAQTRNDYRAMGLNGDAVRFQGQNQIQTSQISNSAVTQSKINSGAVGQAEIASNSVGRSEIKTSTGSQSGSAQNVITLNAWSFFPDIEAEGNGPVIASSQTTLSAGADSPEFSIDDQEVISGNSIGNFDIAWRYIQSSPPYNLGDGQVGVFTYLSLDQNGDIQSVWLSEDPPWYGIGTTMIDGKPHYIENDGPCFEEVQKGNLSINEWRQKRTCKSVPIDKDPHRFCDRRPKPFPGDDNVVLLDPSCDLSHELRQMHHEMIAVPEEPNLTAVLSDGYFEVKRDVTDERRANIPDVCICECDWK